ncbi:hypothetical protein [Nostoc favosum]|uniref:Uncharacterized protein n=1 Tax=Nostoc favosum CHAB5714 TaxID=2780399 RepID=A0ABS8IE93_9NOSO|nr:hypothetical protein [Nostoc favosum]MCC5602084.1 hypothetical protein [Nostoc favosum CHAB5714]
MRRQAFTAIPSHGAALYSDRSLDAPFPLRIRRAIAPLPRLIFPLVRTLRERLYSYKCLWK